MKRVLFVVPSFKMGGTLISLRNYLTLMDKHKIQADVLGLSVLPGNKDVLTNCNFVEPNLWLLYSREGLSIVKKNLHKILCLIQKLFQILFRTDITPFFMKVGGYLIGSKKYDAVVSFQESISRFVCYYPAKKRIAWIHCEYSRVYKESDKYIYDKFDNIVCVSKYGKSVFDSFLPQFSNKSIAILNVISNKLIYEKADADIIKDGQFDTGGFTILSIGRLDSVKQFYKIPVIVSAIKQKVSEEFRWYIIGGGPEDEKKRVEDSIKNYNVSSEVIMLGERKNVYPYLAQSDLYVNTSKSEAYSLVNNEAKALGVPVVTNDFQCAKETITDGIDGRVVPIEQMTDIIISYLKNKQKGERKLIDNSESFNKFYRLF